MTRRARGHLVDVTVTLDRLADLLGANPATADRFDRWLDEQDVNMRNDDKNPSAARVAARFAASERATALRLPAGQLAQADALVAVLEGDPTIGAMGKVSRSGVLRLALAIGLDELARRYNLRRRVAVLPTGEARELSDSDELPEGSEIVEIVSASPKALDVVLGRVRPRG